MPLSALTSRDAVLAALHEFDTRGREGFLATYGFAPARSYFVDQDGSRYDSKAIAGVAHGIQHPDLGPLRPSDFSGGEATVKRILEGLGFQVLHTTAKRSSRFWALCANPSRYRIRDAVAHVEVDHWLTGRSIIRGGDAVAIWQTRDKEGHRGVVALGQVVGHPESRSDSGNPYWVAPEQGDKEYPRVPVRYHRIQRPLWVDSTEAGSFLASLSVAKSQGGTVFHLTEDQWTRLCDLAGGYAPEEPGVIEAEVQLRRHRRSATGQGFGLSATERTAVEKYAMQMAIAYFSTQWESVKDVSARCSFDLCCSSGNQELRVEVKGTTSVGKHVVLTRREVEEASTPGYALFVVSAIVLRRDAGRVQAHGGQCRVIRRWREDRHVLTPIAYSVALDWSEGEAIALGTPLSGREDR